MTINKSIHFDSQTNLYRCHGTWNINHLVELQTELDGLTSSAKKNITFDGSAITHLDSAGAWLLLTKNNSDLTQFQHFSPQQHTLLTLVAKHLSASQQLPARDTPNSLEKIGIAATKQWQGAKAYLTFIGQLTAHSFTLFTRPSAIRYHEIAGIIYRNGYQAIPIIALLSFMIGLVIAYQMGLQLKNYGANIYIVDLMGLAILREFSPLLTSIIVAGRTGSAYTAQLGIMKINQEIDALDTLGITSIGLLLLPRIIGLLIALPLLVVCADIFGVLGGMVMSNSMLDITAHDFLSRFSHVIKLKNLVMGLGKAPVFALIIATVSLFQGMQVSGSAVSLGSNTTRSVVLSIFCIILADAFFSIIFSMLKL